jgi:hypothetical protein
MHTQTTPSHSARRSGARPRPWIGRSLALTCVLALVGCDIFAPERIPSTVEINEAAVSLADGDSARLSFTVFDQEGKPFQGAGDEWSPRWETEEPEIASVSEAGWVRGEHPGETVVRVHVDGLRGQATVSVNQTASELVMESELPGEADAGEALGEEIVFVLRDRHGAGVGQERVRFELEGESGTISRDEAVTDADGRVSLVWTLKPVVGQNGLRALASDAGRHGIFSGTYRVIGIPGAAGEIEVDLPAQVTHGDTVHVSATVVDRHGNALSEPELDWSSSAPDILGVEEGDILVAHGPGEATMRATSGEASLDLEIDVARPTIDFRIDGLHLTQAIQTYDGYVPLIAGRDGLLRVFAIANEENDRLPDVSVRLYRNGAHLKTLSAAGPPAGVPLEVEEGYLGLTWNVDVPGDLIQNGLSVRAVINPGMQVAERDTSNNAFPAGGGTLALDVQETPDVLVRIIPIHRVYDETTGGLTDAEFELFRETAAEVLPVEAVDLEMGGIYTTEVDTAGLEPRQIWTSILREVDLLRLAEGSNRLYYGVMEAVPGSGIGGMAYLGGRSGIGRTNDWTFAHELGHNFGLRHAPCGNPSGVDDDFPHEGAGLGAIGWSLAAGTLMGADGELRDMMSYCRPRWISDYNYGLLREWLQTREAPYQENFSSDHAQESLVVWGEVSDGGVLVEPSFSLAMRPVRPSGRGSSILEGLNGDGRVLFSYRFDPQEIEHAEGTEGFTFAIPLSEIGDQPAAIRVRSRGHTGETRSRGTADGRRAAVRARSIRGAEEFSWDGGRYPLAIIQDASTGRILSIGRSGRARIPAARSADVRIILSDGTRSTVVPRSEVR